MIRRALRIIALAIAAPLLTAGLYCASGRTWLHSESSSDGRIVAGNDMAIPRASQTATLLSNGKVLIAGGFAGSGAEGRPYRSTEFYDPSNGKFSPGPEMTVGRSGQTATMLKDGRILMAGGWGGPYQTNGSAEIYDSATNSFKLTGSLVVSRAHNTATLLNDGMVLIVGGVNASEEALSTAELYNPTTGTFSLTGSMAEPRGEHSATLLKDGRVLIAGGGSGHYPSQTVYHSAEIYDPATGKFTSTGQMAIPRHKHAAVLLHDGRALIVGGSDNRDWRGEYSSAELYDPTRGTFVQTGSMSQKRFKLDYAAVLMKDGRVLVAGGGDRAEIYDPRKGRFSVVAGSLEAARFFASATLLPSGDVLVAGGYAESHDSLPSLASTALYIP